MPGMAAGIHGRIIPESARFVTLFRADGDDGVDTCRIARPRSLTSRTIGTLTTTYWKYARIPLCWLGQIAWTVSEPSAANNH